MIWWCSHSSALGSGAGAPVALSGAPILDAMDRLWTPWRYNYITGAETDREAAGRKGVPKQLAAWPGPADGQNAGCVFCNLLRAVEWAIADGMPLDEAERAGLIVARLATCYVCLNAFPYSSGHVMVVPKRHTDSLATLTSVEAGEMMDVAQRVERALLATYRPDGINFGMNLGEAAGAGVADHLHLHGLPRWFGDTNFMTVTAETRVLPESLEVTWERLRAAWGATV